MILFDVKCQILEPLNLTDASGADATIAPGSYHLRGVDHLIRSVGGGDTSAGTDLTFVRDDDGDVVYRVSAEKLAHFIAMDEIEVRV
jgi:hypothetical protein